MVNESKQLQTDEKRVGSSELFVFSYFHPLLVCSKISPKNQTLKRWLLFLNSFNSFFIIHGMLLYPNSKDPLPASAAEPERIPLSEYARRPHDKIYYHLPDGK